MTRYPRDMTGYRAGVAAADHPAPKNIRPSEMDRDSFVWEFDALTDAECIAFTEIAELRLHEKFAA